VAATGGSEKWLQAGTPIVDSLEDLLLLGSGVVFWSEGLEASVVRVVGVGTAPVGGE